MKIVGNIIWLIFGGFIAFLMYMVIGALLCVTIIGIPFGLQCFKIGKLFLWPFGKKVETNFDKHPIANIIWLILVGWGSALSALITGAVLFITIIGIPFGKQWFKLAKLVLLPFGAEIKEAS
ncbi:MAG TPA: YccF domain-containing protein [Acholeplasmataceae bacterium]|nr:YccF domain-containing protein [Acholeplasmataceae bacterium]